jgi:hypothetical protein
MPKFMASFLVACFLVGVDFCFQSWYHMWCSDFLLVYLIRSVLYADRKSIAYLFEIGGIVFLSAVEDFFMYGIFGFRLVWITPCLVGVWSLANLFRYRLFLLSSLLVVGVIVLQEGVAFVVLGRHGTLHAYSIKFISALFFILFNDLMHFIKNK